MLRVLLALLIILPAVVAQQPVDLFDKAPPQVDDALRARVTRFFQFHVEGKFRQADALVAEDSKDIFFAAEKNKYYSFEIVKIKYSDNFTKAAAVVACETDFNAGFQRVKVKMPVTSLWKLENGEWWWYALPPAKQVPTPFGTMTAGADSKDAGAPAMPDVMKVAQEIARQVRIDRQESRLSSFEPATDRITISNNMQGSIELSLDFAKPPGFEAKLDKTEVKAGESAHLDFKYSPVDKTPKETLIVKVHVSPTGQVIPIRITFAVPEMLTPGRVR